LQVTRSISDTCARKWHRGGRRQEQNREQKLRQEIVLSGTDNEAELFLKVMCDYKVAKTSEGIDWESIQSQYRDILERVLLEYPATQEAAAKELQKDYPHKKSDITKQIVTTKLKAIRIKFRRAVDLGRKSGHGRVVMLYFDLCKNIWGGGGFSSNRTDTFWSRKSRYN